jgi:hypothetical protein
MSIFHPINQLAALEKVWKDLLDVHEAATVTLLQRVMGHH